MGGPYQVWRVWFRDGVNCLVCARTRRDVPRMCRDLLYRADIRRIKRA